MTEIQVFRKISRKCRKIRYYLYKIEAHQDIATNQKKGNGGDGRFSFSESRTYLTEEYTHRGLDKNGIKILRQRATYFAIRQNDRFYIVGGKHALHQQLFLVAYIVLLLCINI